MLPFSLLSAVVSMISGLVIVKIQAYRPVLWFGHAVSVIGYGLMATLTSTSSTAKQEVYIGVAAIGLGCLFQTPLVALTSATREFQIFRTECREDGRLISLFSLSLLQILSALKQMARVTGSMQLIRSISGAAGISLAGAIFNSVARTKLGRIDGYNAPDSPSSVDAEGLVDLQPPDLALSVVSAYAGSIQIIWIAFAPVAGVGFLSVLGVKGYSLKRRVKYDAGKGAEKDKVVSSSNEEETGDVTAVQSEVSEEKVAEKDGDGGKTAEDLEAQKS